MSSISKFVYGGGSVSRQRFGRPKLRLFTLLATAWSTVSAVPLWMLLSGTAGPVELSGLPLLCFAFVLPQPVFIALAVLFCFTEQPRHWTETVGNPDYDLRNLY
jgi:hypothetical protein